MTDLKIEEVYLFLIGVFACTVHVLVIAKHIKGNEICKSKQKWIIRFLCSREANG